MLPPHVNPLTNRLLLLHASRQNTSALPSKHLHRRSFILPIVAWGSLTFMTVAVICFFFVYWYRTILKRRRSNKTSPEDGSSLKIHKFNYRQLKAATKNFSESHKLGKGGFGIVYKGILKNGKEVAVKRLELSSFQGEREFQNELAICSRLHSSHVIRLLGFCTHGKRVRLLVYECMQNRSLQEALFEKGYHTYLDWDKRCKIILDVAKALEFLHLHCDPPIIHGDVKPSNVLLDSNFSARIADFGLARFKTTQQFDAKACSSVQKVKEYTCQDCTVDAVSTSKAKSGGCSPSSTVKYIHSERSCGVSAEAFSRSVHQSLLSKEVTLPIRVSGHDQAGGPYDAISAFTTPCPSPPLNNYELVGHGEAEAGLPGSECGQNRQRKDVVHVPHEVEACEESMGAKGRSRLQDWDFESGTREKRTPKSTHRKSREWWKEEYFAELSNKINRGNVNVKKTGRSKTRSVGNWKELLGGDMGAGDLSGELRRMNREAEGNGSSCNKWLGNSWSGDLSWLIRGGDRRLSRAPSQEGSDLWSGELNASELMNRRQWSGDLITRNGELISRDLSSTTASMRGTICYIAPQYGGYGVLSEKSDIYSFGVLLLVILSGRRPIQVTANSPLQEFERANLISWARWLSKSGKLLELMDPALHGEYDLQQASICINVALLCLQRVPERRPNISQVVKTLLGETMVPPLISPELSPPPASRTHHKLLSQSLKEYHSVTIT